MPAKISLSILGALILAVALFGVMYVAEIVTSERDGWDLFSRVDTTTDLLTVEPPGLLSRDDREAIEHVVNETRGFGIPWSIWVASRETLDTDLPSDQIAHQRFEEEPVESSEGAGDGLLMAVIVPESDQTQAEVAFVTGPNFYPRGGITPERLDYIADVQMQILFDDDRLGDGVIEGATWVEWTQLFEPTPNPPPTHLQQGLQDLLDPLGALGIAGIAAIVAGASLLVRFLTWRGAGKQAEITLNGVTAAAVARGQVDDAVIDGVILDAVDRGVLIHDEQGTVTSAASGTAMRWDASLTTALADLDRSGSPATLHRLSRQLRRRLGLHRTIEDTLAQQGLFHPRSPLYSLRLRWLTITGAALGLVGIVIAIAGESTPTIAASLALAVISLGVLIWNERRSWRTRDGSRAIEAWLTLNSQPDNRERVLFETIRIYETVDLLPPDQSPLRPDSPPLITALGK